MRHVSRNHRVALDWLFDRIDLGTKIQIKYIDIKNQLADMLTEGNFARDEWNHLLFLFNIRHFNSTNCSEVMSKRTQKDSSEERVTAKSKPMMSLVSRCSERTPDVLPSTASESSEKPDMKVNFLWARELSGITEQSDLLKTLTHQATQNGMLIKLGLLKSVNLMNWWTIEQGDLLYSHSRFIVDDDVMDSYTVTESDLSLKSRSFLHRMNDRVRKMLDHSSKDATKDSDKHSVRCRMFVSSTLQASVFMVKNDSDNLHFIKNTENFTMKQMFDTSEVDSRTNKWDLWSDSIWLGRFFMEIFTFGWWWRSHQSLAHKGSRIFRFCIMPWKDEREPTIKLCMRRQIGVVQVFTRIQSFGHNWWYVNGKELRENLMDDRVPERRDSHASSSHEPSLEPTPATSVVSGKHSIFTHFPKDRNCEICQRTKITRAPCRRRISGAALRAENVGDLITADHKVLSEGCESRNNHRCAVVVQDLATQWIQSYPCKTKTSQETQRSLLKFLEPDRKLEAFTLTIPWNLAQSLWRSFL